MHWCNHAIFGDCKVNLLNAFCDLESPIRPKNEIPKSKNCAYPNNHSIEQFKTRIYFMGGHQQEGWLLTSKL